MDVPCDFNTPPEIIRGVYKEGQKPLIAKNKNKSAIRGPIFYPSEYEQLCMYNVVVLNIMKILFKRYIKA